jgi:hypothetical protein
MKSYCHLAGFRARIQARANPPQRDMPDDHLPDPDDTADFELPDQQTLIDAFTAGLSKESQHDFRSLSALLATLPLADPSPSISHAPVEAIPVAEARERGLIPEASDETLRAFSFSEMKLYKHATKYRWTQDELIATINLIKSTDFKVEDVNVDLHKRVAAAIANGHFTTHNMRESDLDGDQDLTLWLRSLEDVLREVLGDDRMAGHQHFSFEMLTNDDGEREFGASNGAVSFQIAQVRCGPDCVPVSLVIYIDGSFIKHGIPVKPIYGMLMSYAPYMMITILS